jgi:hypothetical protein
LEIRNELSIVRRILQKSVQSNRSFRLGCNRRFAYNLVKIRSNLAINFNVEILIILSQKACLRLQAY